MAERTTARASDADSNRSRSKVRRSAVGGSAPVCFVICALGEPESRSRKRADAFLHRIVTPVVQEFGYRSDVQRADLSFEYLYIPDAITRGVIDADLVVADLTELNPNVFFELGQRHALGGRRIHFTSDEIGHLPFDVRQIRTISYGLTEDKIEKAKQQFRSVLAAQLRHRPQGLALNASDLVDRFGATVLEEISSKERRHYSIAAEMLRREPQRIFLLQRSSTMILGPRVDWADEALFYELLIEQIAAGAEFYHIVDLDGIKRHFEAGPDFANWAEAQQRLTRSDGHVGVAGRSKGWSFRRLPEGDPAHDQPDHGARILLVEFGDRASEAGVVVDIGRLPTSLHFRGPDVGTLWNDYLELFEQCPVLDWKAIDSIFVD